MTLPLTPFKTRPHDVDYVLHAAPFTRKPHKVGLQVADAYLRCVAGCDIRRGAQCYRDTGSIYCVEHAPLPVTIPRSLEGTATS